MTKPKIPKALDAIADVNADEDDLAAWGRWNANRVAELESETAALRAERDRLVAGLTALEQAIRDMQKASALIDGAADGTAYQLGLVSLALMARKFMRDFPAEQLAALRRTPE